MRASVTVQELFSPYSASVAVSGVEKDCSADVVSVLSYLTSVSQPAISIALDGVDITDEVFSLSIALGKNRVGTADIEVDASVSAGIGGAVSVALVETGSVLFAGEVDGINEDKKTGRITIRAVDALSKLRDSELVGNAVAFFLSTYGCGYLAVYRAGSDLWKYIAGDYFQLSYPGSYIPSREIVFTGESRLSALQELADEMCCIFYIDYASGVLVIKNYLDAPIVNVSPDDVVSLVYDVQNSEYTGVKVLFSAANVSDAIYEYEVDGPMTLIEYGWHNGARVIVKKEEISHKCIYYEGTYEVYRLYEYVRGRLKLTEERVRLCRKLFGVKVYEEIEQWGWKGKQWTKLFVTKEIIEVDGASRIAKRTRITWGWVGKKWLKTAYEEQIERWDENGVLVYREIQNRTINQTTFVLELVSRAIERYFGGYTVRRDVAEYQNGLLQRRLIETKALLDVATPEIPIAEIEQEERSVLVGDDTLPLIEHSRFISDIGTAKKYAEYLALFNICEKNATVSLNKIIPIKPGWWLLVDGEGKKIFVDEVVYRFSGSSCRTELRGGFIYV